MADDDEDIVEDEEQVAKVEESETVVAVSDVAPLAPPKYEVRPGLGEKFQAENVKEIIISTMQQQLSGRAYRSDEAARWAKAIANTIRQRVQELDMKRYKICVYTTLLETTGAGVKCGQRCIWDPETDDYADNVFRNDTIFCYAVVYGIYMY